MLQQAAHSPMRNQDHPYSPGQVLLLVMKDSQQTLKGHFHRYNKIRQTIALKQVSKVPCDGRVFEQLELELYNIHDISSVLNIEDVPPKQTACSVEIDEKLKKSLLVPKNTTPGNSLDSDTTADKKEPPPPRPSLTNQQFTKIERLVENCIFLDELDENFSKAMSHLSEYRIIGLSGEGSSEARFGLTGVLGLSIMHTVYIIDIINLGKRAFSACNGALKKILESYDVLKIVHDCRLLSDCLYHKYGIKLGNVYDTQVMHAVIIRNISGLYPKSAASLSDLLTEHLGFPDQMIGTKDSDVAVWRRRPIERMLVVTAAWRVAVLLPMRHALDEKLYAPFDSNCKLYLDVVRNGDTQKAQEHMTKAHLLPSEMKD